MINFMPPSLPNRRSINGARPDPHPGLPASAACSFTAVGREPETLNT